MIGSEIMRLIANEFLKLLSKRVFTICVIISLFVNFFFLIYVQESEPVNKAVMSNKGEYKIILEECTKSDDPNAYLEKKKKETSIAIVLDDLYENADAQYVKQKEEEIRAETPVEYEEAKKLNLTKEELQNRLVLLTDVNYQLEYVDDYYVFIEEMETRAENQMNFSIFAKEDTFSYKNIQKTPKDFENLKGVQIQPGNSKAIDTATQFSLTDYLILVITVLLCIFMFSVERENGLYPLVRSTRFGRTKTVLSKLFVVATVTSVLSVVFYISNFIFCGVMFGFGDLGRNIQSSQVFMNCSLDITIIQYLLLWIFSKMMLFVTFAMVLSALFVLIKTPAKVYMILSGFLVIEYSLYFFVDDNSVYSMLKHVNFAYMMNHNNIFGIYQNVNLFGTPINIISVFFMLSVFLIIVAVITSCFAFSMLNQELGKMKLLHKFKQYVSNHSRIRGSVRVFNGEVYKHYVSSFVWIVIAGLLLFSYMNITEDININFKDPQESAYNQYLQNLEGEMTEQKYEFINDEQGYFDSLLLQQEEILNDDTLTADEKDFKITSIQSVLDTKGVAFQRVQSQLSYAQTKSKEIGKSVTMINEVVNKRLTQDVFREWGYFTLLLAIVVFSTSNIFSCEFKRSMVNLLRSNRNGKTKLVITKLFVVLLTFVTSFVMIYLPYYINYIKTFGTSSFSLPLAFSSDFVMLRSPITVFEYVCVLGFTHFIVALAVVTFVYMLSLILHNHATTLIISSGVVLVPCIITMTINDIRMVNAFKSNVWLTTVMIISLLCICIIVCSLTIAYRKFNNIVRRKKNANS